MNKEKAMNNTKKDVAIKWPKGYPEALVPYSSLSGKIAFVGRGGGKYSIYFALKEYAKRLNLDCLFAWELSSKVCVIYKDGEFKAYWKKDAELTDLADRWPDILSPDGSWLKEEVCKFLDDFYKKVHLCEQSVLEPNQTRGELFLRTDESKEDSTRKTWIWDYTSHPLVKFTLSSPGFGDGDSGHGGKVNLIFEGEGFDFDLKWKDENSFALTVGGRCECQILRDFFHQAAKAMDEISEWGPFLKPKDEVEDDIPF